MKKLTSVILVLFVLTSLQLSAQQKEESREEGQETMETITDAQKEKLKTILSNYDSQSLTAKDAKAIHEAFRETGLRAGPATADAMREIGFDPDKLRDLAPPPDMEGKSKRLNNNSVRLTNHSDQQKSGFTMSSSGIKPDGSLSKEFTGDGEGVSMPLEWTNIPEGTQYFALNLWHLPHPTDLSDVKSYWVVYNIPADITSIPKNAKGFGSDGYNDKNHTGYDPMKSKGPGIKDYNLTIYALSEKLVFKNKEVSRADLLKAVEGKILDECTLKYTYERGTE